MKTKENAIKKANLKLIALIVIAIAAISSIIAYFTSTDMLANVFGISSKNTITYEYYTVNTLDGTITHLDKQELNKEGERRVYPTTTITLGEDTENMLTAQDLPQDMDYVRMDFQIQGEEEKRNSGYQFSMPREDITINQYYYLTPRNGNIIIHHYRAGTPQGQDPVKVAEDEELTDGIGKAFTVTNLIDTKDAQTQEYVNKLIIDNTEVGTPRNYINSEVFSYQNVEVTGTGTTTGANGEITGTITQGDIVITYYYNAISFSIAGEVVGGNGQISNIAEEVLLGNNSTKDIIFTPDVGYRVEKIMVYSGDEITQYRADATAQVGTEITDFDEEIDAQTNKLVATMDKITNVRANKLVVVSFEPRPYVAQIIAVPTDTTNLTSTIFPGQEILNHKYYTLQEALDDAYYVNQTTNETNRLVEIQIIDNIRNESVNIVKNSLYDNTTENIVSIDLNGFTVVSNKNLKPAIDVNYGSSLVVKDTSVLETGKLISNKGVGIYVEKDAELTLGVNQNPISIQAPYIEGTTYGIYKEQVGTEEGELNFYDGKVYGNIAIYGTVNDWPTTRKVYVEYDDVKEKNAAYLAALENIEAVIGKKTYTQVEDAINEANTIYGLNGEPVLIEMVSDAVVESTMEILANRNVTLDLHGYTISSQQTGSYMFENSGNFEIKSTEEIEYDYIMQDNDGIRARELAGYNPVGHFVERDGSLVANIIGTNVYGSYVPIDLSQYSGNVQIAVKAEIKSVNGSIGFCTIAEDNGFRTYTMDAGRFVYVNQTTEETEYTTTVQGGKKYYLHLGLQLYSYYNEGQEFKINEIKVNGETKQVGMLSGTLTQPQDIILNKEDATLTLNRIKVNTTNNNTNYCISNNGELTINDAVVNSVAYCQKAAIQNNGTFTLNEGAILTPDAVYSANATLDNYGTATINGGILNTRLYNKDGATITINNGNIVQNLYNYSSNTQEPGVVINGGAIYNPDNQGIGIITINDIDYPNLTIISATNGTINFNDGNIRGVTSTYVYNNAQFNMTGGTIQCSDGGSVLINVSNSNTNVNITGGSLIAEGNNNKVIDGGNGNVNISNCTITDTATYYLSNGIYHQGSGTITINDNTLYTYSGPGIAINNLGTGSINIYGGTITSNTTNQYAVSNTGSGAIIIGRKNDAQNTEVSTTNPTIKSEYGGMNIASGEFKFYDGQIIAPVGRTLVGGITEIEEQDSLGNLLDINISKITEDEKQYDRMTLGMGSIGVARILKNSSGIDITKVTQDEYYEYTAGGNEYYVFYSLNNAIKTCNKNSDITAVTIELINNITSINNVEVDVGQNIVIDLKGNTINSLGSTTYLQNDGKLEIKNTLSTGEINTMEQVIENTGDLKLNVNITCSKTEGAMDSGRPTRKVINNSGTLEINGGTIIGYGARIINNTNNLTINNGTITGLMGSSSNNPNNAINIINENNAKCEINGGTFYNNSTNTYNTIMAVINNRGTSTLKITNGTFEHTSGVSIYNESISKYEEHVSEPALYITGGTFNSTILDESSVLSDVWVIKDENTPLNIYTLNCTQANLKVDKLGIRSDNNALPNITANGNGVNIVIENSQTGNIQIGDIWGQCTARITNCTANVVYSGCHNYASTLTVEDTTIRYGISNRTSWGGSSTAVTVKNCTINGEGTSGIDNAPGGEIIITTDGTTKIYGPTAIQNYGTLTLGVKGDGAVSITNPEISGTTCGINNTGTFNFYDGIIKGPVVNNIGQSINGTVADVEDGYNVTKTVENSIESAILSKVTVVRVLRSEILPADLAGINYVETTDSETGNLYYSFYSIEAAASACTNNKQTPTTIELESTITYLPTDATQTIGSAKNVILDLKGFTINVNQEEAFINNGTLKIIDSSTGKTGVITTIQDMLFINTGTLEINNAKINANYTGTNPEVSYVISNTGTVNLNNATFTLNNSRNLSMVKNSNQLNVNGGNYSRTYYTFDCNFVHNINNADAQINSAQITGMSLYNSDTATIESVDNTVLYGGIVSSSTRTTNSGNKPAVLLQGGAYTTIFDSNSYTSFMGITNSNGEMVIENSVNSNISLDGGTGYLRCSLTVNSGKVIINSGTIIHDLNLVDGLVEMNAGTFTARSMSISTNGIFNIYGDVVNSNSSITNNGEINIGQIGEQDTTKPTININNTNYQVANNGTLNFNNGIINANNVAPVSGSITSIPANKEVLYTISGTTHTYSLTSTEVIAKIGTTEFTSLEAAFASITTNAHTQIDLQKSIAVADGNNYEINSTKDITLNLNGNKIVGNCGNGIFTNNGTFEITDLSTGGTIDSRAGNSINNTGSLKILGGIFNINSPTTRTIISNTGAGTVEITNGTFNAKSLSNEVKAKVISSTSTGDITLKGGTLNLQGYDNNSRYEAYGIYVVNSNTTNKPTIKIQNSVAINNINPGGDTRPYSCGFDITNGNVEISGGNNQATYNTVNGGTFTATAGTTGQVNIGNTVTAEIKGTATTGLVTNSGILTTSGNATIAGITNLNETIINGGTITGTFTNNATGTINAGTIRTSNTAIISNSTIGTEINNGAVIESTGNNAIVVQSGICNVYEGVTVTSTNGTGIVVNNGATLTLGIKALPVNTATPTITGSVYGINNNGTFNFYDGVVTGTGSGALGGTVAADLPVNYSIQTANGATVAWLESMAQASDVASVNGIRYKSLQAAINAITSGTITIIDQISLDNPIVIDSNKTITIDLHTHNIEYTGADGAFINNGTLTIVDTEEDGQQTLFSIIKNTTGPAIQNNGTLTIGSDADSAVYSNSPRIQGTTYAIVNITGATFNFYDGILKGATAAVNGSITNTTTITGYTLTDGTETISGTTYHTKYYDN